MKIKTIDVSASEWFDKVNGNSYFSGLITLNFGMANAVTLYMGFQYGYGSQFEAEAGAVLDRLGILPLPRHENGSRPSLWKYCQDRGIILRCAKRENCRKRDLMKFEEAEDRNRKTLAISNRAYPAIAKAEGGGGK